MKVFRGFENLNPFVNGVATIGSFDGVHCGHRALLSTVRRLAAERGGESVVFTFDPHPRITLGRAEGLKLLNTTEEKLTLLAAAGIDNTVVIPFTEEFSRLSPDEFIADCIVRAGVRTLAVGYNHRFGRDKAGDYAYLSSARREVWPEVVEVEQQLVGSGKVSSTVIRRVIAEGDMAAASRLLGEPYIFIGMASGGGEVVSPERDYKLLPPAGEYAAEVDGRRCAVHIADDGRLFAGGLTAAGRTVIKIENRIC